MSIEIRNRNWGLRHIENAKRRLNRTTRRANELKNKVERFNSISSANKPSTIFNGIKGAMKPRSNFNNLRKTLKNRANSNTKHTRINTLKQNYNNKKMMKNWETQHIGKLGKNVKMGLAKTLMVNNIDRYRTRDFLQGRLNTVKNVVRSKEALNMEPDEKDLQLIEVLTRKLKAVDEMDKIPLFNNSMPLENQVKRMRNKRNLTAKMDNDAWNNSN